MNGTGGALLRPVYRLYEERLLRSLDRTRLPRHIGVIHDGHRRFARLAGLPDYASSYRAGMDKFVEFLGWCRDLEVPALTCWLLSQENLERPADELNPYYDVLVDLFGADDEGRHHLEGLRPVADHFTRIARREGLPVGPPWQRGSASPSRVRLRDRGR